MTKTEMRKHYNKLLRIRARIEKLEIEEARLKTLGEPTPCLWCGKMLDTRKYDRYLCTRCDNSKIEADV